MAFKKIMTKIIQTHFTQNHVLHKPKVTKNATPSTVFELQPTNFTGII